MFSLTDTFATRQFRWCIFTGTSC